MPSTAAISFIIVRLIRRLHHGVIEGRAGYGKPADHIRVFQIQFAVFREDIFFLCQGNFWGVAVLCLSLLYDLKRNFEKKYSDLGTPYIQENCDLTGSDNLVIYGHHIKGGKMFGALENYKSQSFYEEHKTIQFDTLTQRGEYEIIAVFKTVAYSSQGFRYYDFVNAESEDEFNAYIQKCKELALYETGVTAEYGDRLITLSTCEYSAQNGRLVVVAKKTA